MHVISRKRLVEFWDQHSDSKQALRAWYHESKSAKWKNNAELKQKFSTASIINAERVVFDICGNKYRLIVHIIYGNQTIFIRFIGTHSSYNKVNAATV